MKRNEIVAELRRLSREVKGADHSVRFPSLENAEHAQTMMLIRNGGTVSAHGLAGFIYYTADMMEE